MSSIDRIIPKALIDFDISHDDFTLVIDVERNCFGPKETIRAKVDQLLDIERDRLTEYGKRVGQNEQQILKLKTELTNI